MTTLRPILREIIRPSDREMVRPSYPSLWSRVSTRQQGLTGNRQTFAIV